MRKVGEVNVMPQLPVAQWETWTPARAERVLSEQDRFGDYANRIPKEDVVTRYAGDMKGGRWLANGTTIVLNGGRLLDGQHRLRALIVANMSMPFLTVSGVSGDVMATIDSGVIRTPGDVFRTCRGELVGGYYNACAAAARIIYQYLTYGDLTSNSALNPTRQQLLECFDQHSGIMDSVRWLRNTESGGWMRNKTVSAWHYLCGMRYPFERDAFFADLVSGVNLSADAPVRILRERMVSERMAPSRLPSNALSAFIVKAWNADREGRVMKILRFKRDEQFPLLHGDPRRA